MQVGLVDGDFDAFLHDEAALLASDESEGLVDQDRAEFNSTGREFNQGKRWSLMDNLISLTLLEGIPQSHGHLVGS